MNMAFQNFVRKTRLAQSIINYCVIVYMDDILVYSSSYEGHVQHVEWALHALRDAGFKVALEKCPFFLITISFLGHVVTDKGLQQEPQKVAAVRDVPVPTTITQVRAFLGLASYYQRFIKGFVAIAGPLTNLLRKDQPLIWTPECDQAFSTLKAALISAPDYSGMIGRWATVLQSMNFDILHRKHERHGNADGLTQLHRPEKVPKGEEVILWNEPEQEIGPRYGQVMILSKHSSASGSQDEPRHDGGGIHRRHQLGQSVMAYRDLDLAARVDGAIPLINLGHWRLWRETFEELSFCLARVQVTWTGTSEHPTWIENPGLLIIQAWRTNVEGDLLGFLFGSVWPGRRHLIAQELITPIVQLANDLSPDIYFQSDDGPAPYIFERSLDPYLQWTACLEEPRDEDTLPSRQEYLKPYEIIPHAFYPRADEVVIDDDEEEDEDEETSEEGIYSEHSEGELSEGEEEEEETRSEWEALLEEATRTGTEADDPEAARKREEIATGKRQLEFASQASLRIDNDPTRDPKPPKPEDGDPAAATSSTERRRRSRSPSSPSPTRPPVRPCPDADDRPSSSNVVMPTP
ncbi:hypothetical protein CBR_g18740 [Chara braunii]|uniref:Reverse transcriptase domain-containing protein n=1 Tax=Chara braunii TaxID=69332 RepID=A0A388KW97_CHABU|nr:hypothetical protein CBR_g18740 [Chara braunii]|eukprot:GBG74329.1 hypothetical protein CBR_g18740 [Chara braunii]